MKILFVGESWSGSCARSTKEALARLPSIEIDELAEDAFALRGRSLGLRLINRLTWPLRRWEFNREVLEKIRYGRPDFLMVYKGRLVYDDLLTTVSTLGVKTVNIYPDYSPHDYGTAHQKAVGHYDLVISTKPYHPELWSTMYNYQNRCVFVAQGYDPKLHLVPDPPTDCPYDVVMIATYREEYGRLMREFSLALGGIKLKVAIGGYGWDAMKGQLPEEWFMPGPLHGRSYISFLRTGKICIAPLNRNVVIHGRRQPGDVDTTRSYELAAAHCFFVHQRSDFILEQYEAAEVPMFDDGAELAAQVLHYLAEPAERARIALAAHQRAVPEFSTNARAGTIAQILRNETPASNQRES